MAQAQRRAEEGHRGRASEEEAPVVARHTEERDWSEIDALLDDIDEVLAEDERRKFKEKVKGWAANQPRLVAHPLAGEDYIEVPCGCC